MRRVMTSLIFVALVLALATGAAARIINVPGDAMTIGQAIDMYARDGDEIVVAPGTYNYNFGIRKAVTVRSTNPQDPAVVAATVLRGRTYERPVVVFECAGRHAAKLEGFTITGGSETEGGHFRGAVRCITGSAEISHNVITGNETSGIVCESGSEVHIHHNTITNNTGSGIYCEQSTANIEHNTIVNNTGRGIYCEESTPCIEHNTIDNNSGGGIDLRNCQADPAGPSWSISHNIITRNSATEGGGIRCEDSNSDMSFNTIVYNDAGSGAGIYVSSSRTVRIHHCIIYSNTGRGGGVYVAGSAWGFSIDHCDVHGNRNRNYEGISDQTGSNGNISDNPMFVRPSRTSTGADYHLMSKVGYWDPGTESWRTSYAQSACIDAGDPALGTRNEPQPNGGVINIGAYGGTAEASKTPLRMRIHPRPGIKIGPRIPRIPLP